MDSDILRDKGKLKDFLVKDTLIKDEGLDFDSSIRTIFDTTVKNLAAAWLIHVFMKYSEPEFHVRMKESYEYQGVKYVGFDFVTDMKTNHKKQWYIFRKLAPKCKDILIFNDVLFMDKILRLFALKGWKLQDHEIICMHRMIKSIREMIYPVSGI